MTNGLFGMPFNLVYAYHSLDVREHISDQFTTVAVHSVEMLIKKVHMEWHKTRSSV